ncbi:MAG: MCP four helix bundle domain-containing protein [Bacteriovoracaceae bacterium]|nr:MCP four helix bundle domain-containing protein [Bacteriovoracaceae bacterium]
MKALTIKKQLLLFAMVLLCLQGGIVFVGYSALVSVKDNLYSVFERRLPSIDNLVQADRDFQQSLVAERSLLLEGLTSEEKAKFAAEYHKNKKQVLERFNVYKALASSSKEEEIIQKFEENLKQWESTSKSLLNIDELGNFNVSGEKTEIIHRSLQSVNEKFEQSRDQLDLLQDHILNLGASEFDQAVDKYKSAESFIFIFSGVGFVLSLFLSWYLSRKISGKIEKVSDDLATRNSDLAQLSEELRKKSTSLAQASQEQASSVTETSSSLHEISRMVEKNSLNSSESAKYVDESEELVEKGIKIVKELRDSIDSVESVSEEITGSVNQNNADLEQVINAFKEIKEKASVINDIVFQTKLLSFNASVEAARAGEHGKGFSVVAEEIGNLAQESGSSAQEITNLLEESLGSVSELIEKSKKEMEQAVLKNKERIRGSIEHSEKCQEAFENISSKFKHVSETAKEVVVASREQETGVAEINKAMQEINVSIGMTSENASDVEFSSQRISKMVDQITENIAGLESLVKGTELSKPIRRSEPKIATTREKDDSEDRWEDLDAV